MFEQTLVHEGDALVSYLPAAGVPGDVTVGGRSVLSAASPVVWFTFPGRWHDIGRFHRPDGRFTGHYANILTPVRVETDIWETTDLFLDVFVTPAGEIHLLDAEELTGAARAGWIGPELERRARDEAARLLRAARAGSWPPPITREWTLGRARDAAAGTPTAPPVYRNRSDGRSHEET